jgi:uncharacterized protein DUF3761
MGKKLYSNSGLILLAVLAVLAAGVWTSNLLSLYSAKNTPKYPDFDALTSPTPRKSAEDILRIQPQGQTAEDRQRIRQEQAARQAGAIAICVDGTYSYNASSRGPCPHHGGVAQWLR